MTILKWLEPIVWVPRIKVKGRTGIVKFRQIQTKEQEIVGETLEDLISRFLGGISRYAAI